MKRHSQNYEVSQQDNNVIRSTLNSLDKTYSEDLEESQMRLKQINQKEKLQMMQETMKNLDFKNIIERLTRQKKQMGEQLQYFIKRDQQNKKKAIQMALKIEKLTNNLTDAKEQIKNEKIKVLKAQQDMQKWKKSSERYLEQYNKSQQTVNAYMNQIQRLKEKNRNTIIDSKNRLTSLQSRHHLKQFCTQQQINLLLQKQKIYQELFSSQGKYQGKELTKYMQRCRDNEQDLEKILVNMTVKEENYRNRLQTIKKEHEQQNNRIEFFNAECEKIEGNFKNIINIQDNIIVKIKQILKQNERLKKQIQSYRNLEEKVKKSQLKVQEYSKKMQNLLSNYIKNYQPQKANVDNINSINLYKKSQQKCQQLMKKIKDLQIALQQANKKQYISLEDYKKLQNSINNSKIEEKIQELVTLRKNQLFVGHLDNNSNNSTGNIPNTFVNEEKRFQCTQSRIKFHFFECQKEQANNSLIIALQKFQNSSIVLINPLFKSSPSGKDNFGDKIISQASLLLVFKLDSSYLGIFSSQIQTKNEMFMFTFDEKLGNSINQYFARQNVQKTINRMRFREGFLKVGENELVLKNNSTEKVFTLNCGGARNTYFNLNTKSMGIEDKMTENYVKYEELAIYRVYFNRSLTPFYIY